MLLIANLAQPALDSGGAKSGLRNPSLAELSTG